MNEWQNKHTFCKQFCRDRKKDLMKLGIKINIEDIYDDHRPGDSHHTLYFPSPYDNMGTFQACCKHSAIAEAFAEIREKRKEENNG